MQVKDILDRYIQEHPIYKDVSFAHSKGREEFLHPLFVLSQHIIDKLIDEGHNRIAIILPSDECSIVPLVFAKYFSNLQCDDDYAGSVLEDITYGEHMRLNNAVVKFCGINKLERTISIITGRKTQTRREAPINKVHYLFEKTTAAVSSDATWCDEYRKAQKQIENTKDFIDALKKKRTVLKKTIALLTAKNEFRDFVDSLVISGSPVADVAAYGEIDAGTTGLYKLYNKGKLNCIPSVAISSRIEDIYWLLKEVKQEDVFAVFSTIDKFDELINNPDTLKKILKKNIPFVAFLSEKDFENCPYLTDMGFELWHWKPATIKSEALLVDDAFIGATQKGIFNIFARKINNAALSEFKLETVAGDLLKKTVKQIKNLSLLTVDADNALRQYVRKLWAFQNKLTWLICSIQGSVRNSLEIELQGLIDVWGSQKSSYFGQEIEGYIEEILDAFWLFLEQDKPEKFIAIEKFFDSIKDDKKNIIILVPDKYQFLEETRNCINQIKRDNVVYVRTLSSFYEKQESCFEEVDYLIACWFDKNEYIGIKQAYCYENLFFIMYDYENRWREGYVNKVDEYIPHNKNIEIADRIGISELEIAEKPFDRVFVLHKEAEESITDYNTSNMIVRATLGNTEILKDYADVLECVPVLLSNDKIAYFYRTHDVIDVSSLIRGDSSKPIKKDACKLKKGDKILIRQSDKDLIREKADQIMAERGEQKLRATTEIWSTLLELWAKEKQINVVCQSLIDEGAECSEQQIRYWLSGETIMPRDKAVLIAIGMAASSVGALKEVCDMYLGAIDSIYEAGKRVQHYHQQAGRWLTDELKNKATEIKEIAKRSVPQGTIDGIGEVYIYTVEEVFDKEYVPKAKINKIEDLY